MQQSEIFRSLKTAGWNALGDRDPSVPPIHIGFYAQRPDCPETYDLINKTLIKFERFGYTISFGNACDRVWFYPWDQKDRDNFVDWLNLMEIKFERGENEQ